MEADAIVHVIDDDAALRRSIQSLLRSVDIVSRGYDSTRAFLDASAPDVPGCLLLDVRLPGISGLEFQSQLSALGIHMPVVMISAHGDIPMSVRAMKAGAVDFLPKPFHDQDLLDAVALALERDRQRRILAGETETLASRYATLSPREQQVMALITAGQLNKQAAHELGLSEITVKIHRASAMRKMQARTLADLVKMAEKLKG